MSAKYILAINTKTGQFASIAEGVRKFNNYICPSCGGAFIFRDGEINDAHYAHKGNDCGGALMTANHRNAITIIAGNGRIRLPKGDYYNYTPTLSRLEFCHERMRVDLMLDGPEEKLIVEVAATHKIDAEKRAKILAGKIKVLEVIISGLDPNQAIETLTTILIEEMGSKELIDPFETAPVISNALIVPEPNIDEDMYADDHGYDFLGEGREFLYKILQVKPWWSSLSRPGSFIGGYPAS